MQRNGLNDVPSDDESEYSKSSESSMEGWFDAAEEQFGEQSASSSQVLQLSTSAAVPTRGINDLAITNPAWQSQGVVHNVLAAPLQPPPSSRLGHSVFGGVGRGGGEGGGYLIFLFHAVPCTRRRGGGFVALRSMPFQK